MNNNTFNKILLNKIIKEKIFLKLTLKDKKIEEITIEITIDKQGLWKRDLKKILEINRKEIIGISIKYTKYIIENNKSKIIRTENMFLETF